MTDGGTQLQQVTLAQLNAVNAQLTKILIGNSAKEGTPEFATLQTLLARQNLITAQINAIIAEQFQDPPSQGLSAAVASLQQSTNQLGALANTLANIGNVLTVVNSVVQAASNIVTLAGAA
jgi:hypothetical protein